MKNSALTFLKFMWRDFYINTLSLRHFITNFVFIYPLLYSISYGYIIPNTNFNNASLQSTSVILAGSILYVFLNCSTALNMFLLFDFENDKFIEYQITILNPKLLILEKILFSSLFSFLISLPFFPMAKLFLQTNFDTSNIKIYQLLSIMYLGSLTISSYVILATCVLKNSSKIGSWWRRVNNPLLMLGGSWVPWIAIYKFSPILSYIVLLNPILYITEGVRGAIISGGKYIPFMYCVSALIFYSLTFAILTFIFFKKRTDCISG